MMPIKNKQRVEKWLNNIVILGFISIIVVLSIEVLSSKKIVSDRFFYNFQLVVCLIFLLDFFIKLAIEENRWRFFRRNVLFLIVSIPYLSLIHYAGISLPAEWEHLIRAFPLIRGAYGITIAISWITQSRLTTLLFSYLTSLFSAVYFSSLVFFDLERGLNPMVNSYWDALWWACMDVTTVGSDIYGVTFTGQLLSVLLAAGGMMMFPIFTAYITARVSDKKEKTTTT